MSEPSFTVGIEEEYHLIDLDSYNLAKKVPAEFWQDLYQDIGDCVSPEFLQCQVEIGTKVHHEMSEASAELSSLRQGVSEVAAKYNMGLIAASTHPFAKVGEQTHTDKTRYHQLQQDLQKVVRRLLISGMHVHVGIEDPDMRIDLMSQSTYILPHLLALSTSSPFWQNEQTGLMSYRLSVWNEMPRTGLPTHFESYSEYERHVDVLVKCGVIEDSSKIWWDLRPSNTYPTLEMRITDICTHVEDAVCIASIYRCWLRMLYRLRRHNQRWRKYQNFLIRENRWRAHRYGIDQGLIDFGIGEVKPFRELISEVIDLITEDAQALNCEKEVNHAYKILERGTSAHSQIKIYQSSLEKGLNEHESATNVVKWLQEMTVL